MAAVLCHDAQLSPVASDLLGFDLACGMYHRTPCDCSGLDGQPSIQTGQSRYVVAGKLMSTAVVKRGAAPLRRLGMVCAEASSTEMILRRQDMEAEQLSSMRQEAVGTSACLLVSAVDNCNAVLGQSRYEEAAVRQAY